MQLAPTIAYHHLTVDDYHKLGEAGILHEDDRVELVEGMLIDMAPIGTGHAGQVNRLVNRLRADGFGARDRRPSESVASGRILRAPARRPPLALQGRLLRHGASPAIGCATAHRSCRHLSCIRSRHQDSALCTPRDSRSMVDRRARSSNGDVPGARRRRLPPDPPARGHRAHQPRTVSGCLDRRSRPSGFLSREGRVSRSAIGRSSRTEADVLADGRVGRYEVEDCPDTVREQTTLANGCGPMMLSPTAPPG